jgi:hypothetical protein
MTTSTIERVGQLRGLGDYLQDAGALATKSTLEYSPELSPQRRQAAPVSYELTGVVIEHHLIALAARLVVVPAMGWMEHVAAEQNRKERRDKKARLGRVLQKMRAKKRR